jgi:nitrate/TMAO reductase-like tetraheme cytochrome c subunit
LLRRGVILALALASVAVVLFSLERPALRTSRSRDACGSCHADVVSQWERSLHRQSFSDPFFQAGYRVDHRPFCRECHAPLHRGARDPAPGTIAYDEGVACTSCHLEQRSHPSSELAADFSARACADCHEFRFPAHGAMDPEAFMQRTEQEWRESGRRETCVDCHMTDGHTMAIEPSAIADAIVIRSRLRRRHGTTELDVRLSSRDTGHAIPTGDVLRALELSVWIDPERPERRLLTRTFGTNLSFDPATGFSAVLREREDSRIPPRGERVERFVFSRAVDSVAYRLDYLRVHPSQARVQGLSDADNRTPLRRGRLR